MGGFVVLYNANGRPVDTARLLGMVGAIAHRGGDGREMWYADNVGIGVVFNRTTPEAVLERLIPAETEGRIIIAADARIDNRRELIATLNPRNRELADSALIAMAYAKWGERCPAYLIGDFAFVLWDAAANRLFAARDHVGVKPFYYHGGGECFAAGSSVGAVFAGVPELPRDPDAARIAEYLAGTFGDVERTFYGAVRRLPASHSVTVSGAAFQPRRYAALEPGATLRLGSDAEYAAAFLEQFTEAVRCRVRGTVSVGAALSGGLDSSSVVCVARGIERPGAAGPLHTYSVVFDDIPESDERPFIEAVLGGGGLEPHFIRGDRTPPLPDIATLYQHLEEPFYAPNMALHWEMFKAAHHDGVRVWLDGLDGDTTVSHGVAYLAELASGARWIRLYREANAFSRRQGMDAGKLFRSTASRPLTDHLRRLRNGLRRSPAHADAWRGYVINPALAAQYLPGGIPSQPRARTLAADHLRRLEWGLHPFLLESLDRAAAAFGIEPRYPFYDRRLIEFCLSLPPHQKLHDGWTRWVLRHAMREILPGDVAWRTGKGNPAPSFRHTLQLFESEKLKAMADNNSPDLARFIDMNTLRTYQAHFTASTATDGEIMELWKALTLYEWGKRFSIFDFRFSI